MTGWVSCPTCYPNIQYSHVSKVSAAYSKQVSSLLGAGGQFISQKYLQVIFILKASLLDLQCLSYLLQKQTVAKRELANNWFTSVPLVRCTDVPLFYKSYFRVENGKAFISFSLWGQILFFFFFFFSHKYSSFFHAQSPCLFFFFLIHQYHCMSPHLTPALPVISCDLFLERTNISTKS